MAWLGDWPVARPRDWIARVNRADTRPELEALRLSVRRGRPFSEEGWVWRLRNGADWSLRSDHPVGPKAPEAQRPTAFSFVLHEPKKEESSCIFHGSADHPCVSPP